MTKKFDQLNDTFNVESEIVPAEPVENVKPTISSDNDIKKDYEYTRGNLYSIIEKGQEAINGILELAQGGTAVGTGINTKKGFDKKIVAEIKKITKLPFKDYNLIK